MAAEKEHATKGAVKAPISSHPAFPAIVALWFAALLGLGSLIFPVILLERLTVVTGIASLVPSAGPPLGFTARAILALAAAIAGAAMGILLARQVARSQVPGHPKHFSDEEPTCRPISAHDELGSEGLAPSEEGFGKAPPRQVVQKRRSLAIGEDSLRSEYLNAVPVPGQDLHDPITSDIAGDEALELGAFAKPGDETGQQETAMTEGTDFTPPENALDAGEGEPDDCVSRQEFVPANLMQAATTPIDASLDWQEEEAEEDAGSADALPFTAPSLRRKVPALDLHTDDEEDNDLDYQGAVPDFSIPRQQLEFAPPAPAAPAPQSTRHETEAEPRLSVIEPEEQSMQTHDSADDDRLPEELGLVQLASRLGASLERRRAQRAAHSRLHSCAEADLCRCDRRFRCRRC